MRGRHGIQRELVFPRDEAERLVVSVLGHTLIEGVGGQIVEADVAMVDVEWFTESRAVEVIVTDGGDALIGNHMFDGARLIIDYVAPLFTLERLRQSRTRLRATIQC